jgi:hypothetical protein
MPVVSVRAMCSFSNRWPKAEDRTRKAAAVLFADAVSTTADRLRTDNG